MNSNVLEVSALSKAYAEWGSEWRRFARWFGISLAPKSIKVVIHDISFTVGKGESIGIVGKNGAGKSTLLKMITGTLAPTTGVVRKSGSVAAILELGMGFQPELTGRENAYQISGLMGRDRQDVDDVIEEVRQFSDIGDAFDHPVRTYSSGMQARVAFAIATAFRPDLLIVDEALAVGDALFQAKCYERIKGYQKEGMSVLLVSHSVSDIVRNCDRAVLLSEGRVKLDGHPRDVTNAYLDEMFGKTARELDSSANVAAGSAGDVAEGDIGISSSTPLFEMLSGRYEDRPGYRAQEHRWGNRSAEIIDYLVANDEEQYPSIVECGQRLRVAFKCLFKESFGNVVPGVMVRTLDGVFIYGTNSLLLNDGRRHIEVEAGSEMVFEFSLPFSLNSGDYLVSLGVAAGEMTESLEPLDRRYDSIIVTSSRLVPFTGLVDLSAELVVF